MIDKIKKLWRENEDFIIVSLIILNIIIFAINFLITYLNYPNKNSLFNILLGTGMISIGKTLLIDIFIFLAFLILIYLPYLFYNFVMTRKEKQVNNAKKCNTKEDNNK